MKSLSKVQIANINDKTRKKMDQTVSICQIVSLNINNFPGPVYVRGEWRMRPGLRSGKWGAD